MVGAFDRIAEGKPARLIDAAFELALDAYPDLDLAVCREQVQAMAEGFDLYLGDARRDRDILAKLNEFFFEELGFQGNSSDYYDPRNSYLHEVIDRRLGIPISLSVLYQELASSAGVRLDGINFPGHFLLAHQAGAHDRLYIDVFHQGLHLDWSDCRRRLGDSSDACESQFPAMSNREILSRILRNLKGIYIRRDVELCVKVQERLARLAPIDPQEQRDLGIFYYHSGRPIRAVKVLEKLLADHGDFPERDAAETCLAQAVKESVLLN
jgi:regulator of sirC expression with transglutaminase-like and TPR domain